MMDVTFEAAAAAVAAAAAAAAVTFVHTAALLVTVAYLLYS